MARTPQNNGTRFLLFGASVVLAVWFALQGEWDKVALFGLIMALLIWAYIRHGSLWWPFYLARKGRFADADQWLERFNPAFLDARDLAYYHWTKALIAWQDRAVQKAAEHIAQVEPAKLWSDRHRAEWEAHQNQMLKDA